MTCSKCGSKIEDDSTFCPFCGNKIKNQNLQNNSDSNVSSNNDVGLNNNISNNNVTLMSSVPANNYENLNSKSLIFGILGFIFFPCAIVAICMGASYKKKTNKTAAGFVLGIISCALELVLLVIIGLIIALSFKFNNDNQKYDGNDNNLKDYYENGSNINYQTVGNDQFGYLVVSKDWNLYSSSDNNTLQYSYGSTSDILTMYAIKNSGYTLNQYADSVKSRIQNYGADNVSYEIVNVGQYKAIKQQAYLSTLSSYMTTWCFKDEYDVLHYISVNSNNNTNHQDIVTTFKLKK
ncbi:MAG: zinc-ribbon domain-containing protein [Bacilli bacterium]|nr:zinc-ribbon domain-containing protein [Bacilli bacterium]